MEKLFTAECHPREIFDGQDVAEEVQPIKLCDPQAGCTNGELISINVSSQFAMALHVSMDAMMNTLRTKESAPEMGT